MLGSKYGAEQNKFMFSSFSCSASLRDRIGRSVMYLFLKLPLPSSFLAFFSLLLKFQRKTVTNVIGNSGKMEINVTYYLYPSIAWAGLSLVYISQTLSLAQFAAHHLAFVENEMTSVERVLTYTDIEPEPGYEIKTKPPKGWPRDGRITFKDVSLRYYPDGPEVLNSVSVGIEGNAKIGVAGRTGAGKSSLIAAILRMPEASGTLEIDGIDVATLNLLDSRKSISVLGQTPLLFSGPVRTNLDPLGQHVDAELWRVLELVQLKSLVDQLEGQLDHQVSEGGGNFSVGERQLFCLARVLLQRNKVVILDEPTAHVDSNTEESMQTAVREYLKECTVITVAHRLNTIRECDKIVVMDGGTMVEFGSYNELIKKEDGLFAGMTKNMAIYASSDYN